MIIFAVAIAIAEVVNPVRILATALSVALVYWWVTPRRRFVIITAVLAFIALMFSVAQRTAMEIPSDIFEFSVVTLAGLVANCIIFTLIFCGIRAWTAFHSTTW
ncbi:hypothetical protein [Rhizobium sp. BK379]|uniref:hypothetical protein n=1 Tax=Rhizobium sp. BK379 TaxID=2587059 RepID=UPI0003743D86|nr:hypothetical protein [Rhizobium sp. BK379]MBB3441188.1 lysylphosphatidylglycerol synthetase-like protein (DUF2156 family) [Rhizobium sp. BK379]